MLQVWNWIDIYEPGIIKELLATFQTQGENLMKTILSAFASSLEFDCHKYRSSTCSISWELFIHFILPFCEKKQTDFWKKRPVTIMNYDIFKKWEEFLMWSLSIFMLQRRALAYLDPKDESFLSL